MFAVVGVADGVFVIDLVAASAEQAALAHFNNVADAFEKPFNSAMTAWHAFIVIDGGNENVLGLHGVGRFQRPNLDPTSGGIEVAEIAPKWRPSMRADNVAGRQKMWKIARILTDAQTSAQEDEHHPQRNSPPPAPGHPCHA